MRDKVMLHPSALTSSASIAGLLPSFERSLRAVNKADGTVRLYVRGALLLANFLAERDLPQRVGDIRKAHVEAFLVELLSRVNDTTAHNYHQYTQQFFRWCVEEEILRESPMRGIKAPKTTERLPDVLTEELLAKMLAACAGKSFEARRDTAVLRLLFFTGMRRAELCGMTADDIDFSFNVVRILGKGRRERAVAFGRKTAVAIDRYSRVRAQHPHADSPMFWLGQRGPLGGGGVLRIIKRRALQAGIDRNTYVHLFRHSFAHQWLMRGGQEGDLMRLAGWRSREMLDRYGKSAQGHRAREAYQRFFQDE